MLRKATFFNHHFDENFNFLQQDVDPSTRKPMNKVIKIINPVRDLQSVLCGSSCVKLTDEETKKVAQLKDLLDKCFILDPAKRITPADALNHPFLKP